ncbi:MAG: hydantoinase/oxoprolinase family protein [Desulfurococcales archaeon]|nr:hydantoinase/oxoprolinase family protein [Desulfurococcales archaeon]
MAIIGIDVGGTFTDLVLFDRGSGILEHLKVLTTPKEPVIGIMNAIGQAIDDLERVDTIIHASTIGTNMFLGQIGIEPPKVALITNEGFRDIIEIGRQNRPELYNLFFSKPKPLVSRNHRVGVRGRIDKNGNIIEDLDKEHLSRRVEELCKEGIKVFAVSFLHSYKNPIHEIEAEKIIKEKCPDAIIVLSHRIDPEPMEYERTSTTVVNAVLKPVLGKYLDNLENTLRSSGYRGKLLIMQSSGGVSHVAEALEKPAMFIESGPSAGAVAVAFFSQLMGVEKALGFDMGGTTAKASSVIKGVPEITTMYEVGGKVHMGRLVRGSGYPVRFPYIDLAEVSAGGGTIAWIDKGGALRVGPISAGADPGPACYGLGGKDPTITDANLVLGRLPTKLAGARLLLSKELAEKAIRRLADQLGLSVEETAWSIITIANTIMSKALRLVSVEKGHDPREFSMFAFGGAGPLHAVEIARDLGISSVIVPPRPGVFSALGLLVTDYKHSFTYPIVKQADELSEEYLEKVFNELEERANKILEEEGIPWNRRVFRRYIEAKYWGQGYTLLVPYYPNIRKIVETFHYIHENRYGFMNYEEEVVIVVARLDAIGVTVKPRFPRRKRYEPHHVKPQTQRLVYFEDGWKLSNIYRTEDLDPGSLIKGPAIIEAPDSTIVVPERYEALLDNLGAFHISEV